MVTDEIDLRTKAIASLKKKHDFYAHVAAFLLVNGMSVVIWWMTGAHFFWPMFLLLGWGIGLFFNAWDVYGRRPSEDRIRREMSRLS